MQSPDTAIEASEPQPADTHQAHFRSQMGQISRHSGVFFAGTMTTTLLGYFFRIFLARVLGPEPLGVYALGMTVVGLLGLIGGMGLSWAAVRFTSIYRAEGKSKESWTVFFYGALTLLVANGALAVGMIAARNWISAFYHSPALASSIGYFAVLLVAGVLSNFFGQVLIGHKEVARRTVLTSLVGGPVTMLLTLLLLLKHPGLSEYLTGQVFGSLFGALLLAWAAFLLTRRLGGFALAPPAAIGRVVFSFSLAAFAMDLLGFLSGQIDKVILGNVLTARDVGIYATAATFVAFIPVLLQSVNQIFAPTIAELHAKGQHALLEALFQTLTKWVIGLTIPLCFILIIAARPVMRIFGTQFESGAIVLAIGTLGQLVNCASGSVGYLLLMSGNERRLVRIQIGMGALMVVLTLALVPRMGMVGAAVATAVVNAGTNLWSLYEVKKNLRMSPYNASYWRLVPAVLAMAAAALLVLRASHGWSVEWTGVGLALCCAYAVFVVVALAKGLDANDKLVVNAVWNRIRGVSMKVGA